MKIIKRVCAISETAAGRIAIHKCTEKRDMQWLREQVAVIEIDATGLPATIMDGLMHLPFVQLSKVNARDDCVTYKIRI